MKNIFHCFMALFLLVGTAITVNAQAVKYDATNQNWLVDYNEPAPGAYDWGNWNGGFGALKGLSTGWLHSEAFGWDAGAGSEGLLASPPTEFWIGLPYGGGESSTNEAYGVYSSSGDMRIVLDDTSNFGSLEKVVKFDMSPNPLISPYIEVNGAFLNDTLSSATVNVEGNTSLASTGWEPIGTANSTGASSGNTETFMITGTDPDLVNYAGDYYLRFTFSHDQPINVIPTNPPKNVIVERTGLLQDQGIINPGAVETSIANDIMLSYYQGDMATYKQKTDAFVTGVHRIAKGSSAYVPALQDLNEDVAKNFIVNTQEIDEIFIGDILIDDNGVLALDGFDNSQGSTSCSGGVLTMNFATLNEVAPLSCFAFQFFSDNYSTPVYSNDWFAPMGINNVTYSLTSQGTGDNNYSMISDVPASMGLNVGDNYYARPVAIESSNGFCPVGSTNLEVAPPSGIIEAYGDWESGIYCH